MSPRPLGLGRSFYSLSATVQRSTLRLTGNLGFILRWRLTKSDVALILIPRFSILVPSEPLDGTKLCTRVGRRRVTSVK